jgi:hypothetical protein
MIERVCFPSFDKIPEKRTSSGHCHCSVNWMKQNFLSHLNVKRNRGEVSLPGAVNFKQSSRDALS